MFNKQMKIDLVGDACFGFAPDGGVWFKDGKLVAVFEAKKLNIPIVGIVDTNADPDGIAYPVPGNDDAIRSIKLFVSKFGSEKSIFSDDAAATVAALIDIPLL